MLFGFLQFAYRCPCSVLGSNPGFHVVFRELNTEQEESEHSSVVFGGRGRGMFLDREYHQMGCISHWEHVVTGSFVLDWGYDSKEVIDD